MTNLIEYGDWDDQQVNEDAEKAAQGTGDFFKLKEGRYVLRFLPPMKGSKKPFEIVWQHFVKMSGWKTSRSFACPRMEKRKFCPACDVVDKLRATRNQADYDKAEDFLASKRFFGNVIVRADSSKGQTEDKGPFTFAFGVKIWNALESIKRDEEEGGNFVDPTDKGFDIVISRKGTDKNDTEYTVRAARSNSPLCADVAQANEWLLGMPDLTKHSRVRSTEDILSLGGGRGNGAGSAAALPEGRTAQDDVVDAQHDVG